MLLWDLTVLYTLQLKVKQQIMILLVNGDLLKIPLKNKFYGINETFFSLAPKNEFVN